MCTLSTARERRLTGFTNGWSRGRDTLTIVCNDCMVRPEPDPDSYPPIDPDDPVPDDAGELSPDTLRRYLLPRSSRCPVRTTQTTFLPEPNCPRHGPRGRDSGRVALCRGSAITCALVV
jgi:hypothetical protein